MNPEEIKKLPKPIPKPHRNEARNLNPSLVRLRNLLRPGVLEKGRFSAHAAAAEPIPRPLPLRQLRVAALGMERGGAGQNQEEKVQWLHSHSRSGLTRVSSKENSPQRSNKS
jgi:hypothetical protein